MNACVKFNISALHTTRHGRWWGGGRRKRSTPVYLSTSTGDADAALKGGRAHMLYIILSTDSVLLVPKYA